CVHGSTRQEEKSLNHRDTESTEKRRPERRREQEEVALRLLRRTAKRGAFFIYSFSSRCSRCLCGSLSFPLAAQIRACNPCTKSAGYSWPPSLKIGPTAAVGIDEHPYNKRVNGHNPGGCDGSQV